MAGLAVDAEVVDLGDGWREVRWDWRQPMVLYPVSGVAAGIVGRVEEWRQVEGIGVNQLEGWL